MFRKPKPIHLLLATVISLSLTAVGCSSNSNKTEATGQSSPGSAQNAANTGNGSQNPSASPLPEKASASEYYQIGMNSATNGDLKTAEEAWRKSIELEPNNADVRTKLGAILQGQGKLDEASTQYQEAIRVNPDFAPAHQSFGVLLVNQGKKDEAVTSLTKARDLFKKDGKTEEQVKTQTQLAVLEAEQGKADLAVADLKEVTKLKPDFLAAHYVLAEVLASQGKPDEAVATLRKAKELFKKEGNNEKSAEIQTNLALLLGKQQKVDEAVREVKEAINIKPDYAPAYYTLARALNTQGKPEEAITNLRKAKDLFKEQGKTPQLIESQFNLALLLGQQKKLDESIAEAKDLTTIKPDFAPAYAILGQSLLQQGKKDEAKENLTKARDLFKEKNQTQAVTEVERVLQQLEQKK